MGMGPSCTTNDSAAETESCLFPCVLQHPKRPGSTGTQQYRGVRTGFSRPYQAKLLQKARSIFGSCKHGAGLVR
jgi:hypothetical protein